MTLARIDVMAFFVLLGCVVCSAPFIGDQTQAAQPDFQIHEDYLNNDLNYGCAVVGLILIVCGIIIGCGPFIGSRLG